MNPKEKQKQKRDRQVFVQKNKKFILLLDKTRAKEMTVSAAILELGCTQKQWYDWKKEYYRLNGLNY